MLCSTFKHQKVTQSALEQTHLNHYTLVSLHKLPLYFKIICIINCNTGPIDN